MKQLVAVYGSLRHGLGNHRLLQGAEFKGLDTTQPEWTMYSLGGFPGLMQEGETPITIEVYEVDVDTFARLDGLEGYPRFYNRVEIDTIYGKAWIYFLQDNSYRDHSIVQSGDWKSFLNN